MRQHITPLTSRVTIAVCCTALLLAAAACHAVSPEVLGPPAPAPEWQRAGTYAAASDLQAADDELIELMLTPTAQIRLGPGRANQESLIRRTSSSALSYTVRSLWSGIVEYIFPANGLFRRGDPLAHVYDPQLLEDIERARERMATENVSPLTIAAFQRPRSSEPVEEMTGEVAVVDEPADSHRPPAVPRESVEPMVEPVEIPDFDFEANRREQDQLREQAELTATAVPAAIAQCQEALNALNAAQEELADRHRLLEQGVLAEEALEPSERRLAEARAVYQRAEATLKEAQEGYDRIAERIARLEDEASAAHEAIQTAREAEAAVAEARARHEAERRQAARDVAENRPEIHLERVGPTAAARAPDAAEAAESADESAETEEPVRVYQSPAEMTELAAPRWEELAAERPGLVSEVLAPRGASVEAGDELLRIANLQLAGVTARIDVRDLRHFTVGRSITIAFAEYDDAVFSGWVDEVAPIPGTDEAAVRLLVVCQSGRFADDPYLALRWMTLEAGIEREAPDTEALQATLRTPQSAQTEMRLAQIFPTIGPAGLFTERATRPTERVDDHYTGRLQLQPMERVADFGEGTGGRAGRLAALTEWRRTYIDGMTTTVLEDGTYISYPADGDVSTAVRLMLEGRVSHRPNLCAATMREALGWGLGDAHQWATRLPRVGYVPREDGLPRPGDILVWPFTYGPNRSQHIGFAVRQGRKLMLLSNLSGTLGTTEIIGGYIAFYKPGDQPAS